MVRLPRGFSPWQAVQQVADDINPFDGGSRDRDIFSETGNQINGVRQDTPLDGSQSGTGATYPDFSYTGSNNGSLLGASTGTSVGSGSSSVVNRQDLDYLSAQEGRYNTLRDSLGEYLRQGLERLNSSEEDARNRATQQNQRAIRDFDTKSADSMAAKNSALGRVDTNARTLSNSVRRTLGLAGGTGGSAYKIAAPMAVARDASAKRGEVMSSFGRNERDIDTARSDTSADFSLVLKDIADRRKREEENLRSGIFEQEQGINNSLAQIAAERAKLTGGNALSAMRPFEARYSELQGELSQLPSRFAVAPARDLKVATPSLRDYLVDRTAINANREGEQSTYSPYEQFIRIDEEEERL